MATQEILSQAEIDSLLTTMNLGMDQPPGPPQPPSRSAAFPGGAEPPPPPPPSGKAPIPHKVANYNFRRPDRVSKEQIRALNYLHDRFARNFSSSLSAYLRSIAEVNLVSVEQLTYAEFILSIPDPTSFNTIAMRPLDGSVALELNPSLVFPLIDRLLGGPGNPVTEERTLTEIEQNVIDGVIRLALDDLRTVWRSVLDIDLQILARETSPKLVQIVVSSEVVILIVFEIKVGNAIGMMNFCIPAFVIEPVGEKFVQQTHTEHKKISTPADIRRLADHVRRARMHVSAELMGTHITVRDLIDLRADDLIRLEQRVTDPATILVNLRPKYEGAIGLRGNSRAVQILRFQQEE
ncbi:MAG: flagellar motor switch protein FliM [Candidatus Schekmanbacteria bacterium]|nr:flagellar motor switch protein FliM [Candidatus Schekmanbacteria bacterium]